MDSLTDKVFGKLYADKGYHPLRRSPRANARVR